MSNITFAEYYDLVDREMNRFNQRIDSGDTIYFSDLERYLNLVNHVLSMLPVGKDQSDVPEDAYNQLHRIKENLQRTMDNYNRAHPNEASQRAGRRRKRHTLRSKKQRKNKKNNRKSRRN